MDVVYTSKRKVLRNFTTLSMSIGWFAVAITLSLLWEPLGSGASFMIKFLHLSRRHQFEWEYGDLLLYYTLFHALGSSPT